MTKQARIALTAVLSMSEIPMERMIPTTSRSTATTQPGVPTIQKQPLTLPGTTPQPYAAVTQHEAHQPDGRFSLDTCPEWQKYTKGSPDYNPVEVDIANYHLRLKYHIESDRLVGDSTEIDELTMHYANHPQGPVAGQFPSKTIDVNCGRTAK